MKRFALFSSVCLLLCASFTPIYAGIPPVRWLPAKPVKITTVNTTLKKATANLARVVIPGYANFLSKKTGRDVLVEKGTLGMNMHQAIGLHEFFFPENVGKLLPPDFNPLPGLEKKTPEYIENTYLHWKQPAGRSRLFLLESGLPAYLTEPQGEEIFIPSAEQLEEALAFYREVLSGRGTSKLPFSPKFAGAMSAVSNLSLLGNAQDAPLILYAAKKDFESSNKFVDYFVIRALVALNAKKELKELADYRIKSLQENEQLPAVWRGANEMYKLDIEDGLIAPDSETMPEFMQKELLMHHPFNYLLLNPSQDVTNQWVDLRAGIHEQFKMALAQEPAGRDVIGQGAVQEEPFTFEPPKPKTSPAITAAPASKKQAVNIYTLLSENDKLLKEALRDAKKKLVDAEPETPVEPSVTPETIIKQQVQAKIKHVKQAPKSTDQAKQKQGRKPVVTPAIVRERLETYINENNGFPDPHHYLLQLVRKTLRNNRNNETDPDIAALQALFAQYKQTTTSAKQLTPAQLLQAVKEFFATNERLPRFKTKTSPDRHLTREERAEDNLRRTIYATLRNATSDEFEQDPALAELQEFMSKHTSNNQLLDQLQSFIAQNDRFPRAHIKNPTTPEERFELHLRQAVDNRLRLHADLLDKDPQLQQLEQLAKEYRSDKKGRTARSTQQILQATQSYLNEYGQLPPSRSALGQAISQRLNGTVNDEYTQALRNLLEQYAPQQKRTAKRVRQELEAYIAKTGYLPPKTTTLSHYFSFVRRKYGVNDPDVQIIDKLMQEYTRLPFTAEKHRPNRRSNQEVLEELQAYLEEHGELPPSRHKLGQTIYIRLKTEDPNNPAIQQIHKLVKEYNTRREDCSPKAIRKELEEYLAKNNNQLPPGNTSFRATLYKVRNKNNPNDPDVQAINNLLREYASFERQNPEQVYSALSEYWKNNHILPPDNSSLRRKASYWRAKGDPNDPYVQKITEFLEEKKVNKSRTPENVLQELTEYIQETGGLPTFKTRLDRAIHQVLQEADPDDPNVQAIAQLLNETESPNRRRTPKQVYEELEAYWQRHQALPESNSSLRRAIRRIRQTGDRSNPYVQKILERLAGGK